MCSDATLKLIREIFEGKNTLIRRAEDDAINEDTKRMKQSRIYKQILSKAKALKQLANRNGFELEVYNGEDRVHLNIKDREARRVRLRSGFANRYRNLEDEYLNLKIAVATMGDAELKSVIQAFASRTF